MKHKHAEVIKAWADGAEIQGQSPNGEWHDLEEPTWWPYQAYRVKPSDCPYKQDAEQWGDALNEAAWAFTEACPVKSVLLFNTCKPALREAIRVYLEAVEKA